MYCLLFGVFKVFLCALFTNRHSLLFNFEAQVLFVSGRDPTTVYGQNFSLGDQQYSCRIILKQKVGCLIYLVYFHHQLLTHI